MWEKKGRIIMEVKDLSLFSDLTENEMKRSLVCAGARVEIYDKDAYIFQQEEEPRWLFLILEGTVMVGQVNFMGRNSQVDYLGEGQCFGETDLFLEKEGYGHFAQAKTRAKVLAVSRHFFYRTCQKNCAHHSKIIFNMMHILAKEADKNSKKIQLLTCGTLGQRIALYLQQLSGGKKTVHLPMNREDLAAYLNTARPSLSRELSQMQDRGVLQLLGRSQIRILSFSLLQDEIDGVNQK